MSKSYYSELYFHFVWRTKSSQKMILPELETQIWEIIRNKAIELGTVPIEIGGIENHLHMLVNTEPTLLLSEFIGKVKGGTTHAINHELRSPRLFRWAEGYGVLSLAKTNVSGVQNYIRNQKRHHDRNTIRSKMERCDRFDA